MDYPISTEPVFMSIWTPDRVYMPIGETEGFKNGKISIGYCQNESVAEQLKELILAKFEDVQIEIHKFRGLCSFYAEKGGVLIGFEKG